MSGLLLLGAHRSYHLYRKETDMRKGFNQLCGIITNELGRQVLELAYFGELKNDEIAEQLQISINTVKTQKARALQLLRLKLDVGSLILVLAVTGF